MARLDLPSKAVDTNFISIPPEEDLVGSDGWENCGKWILTSAEADMAFVDRAWVGLQPLLGDGPLVMLKASTTLLESETAVIQCFTKSGEKEAKRAAEAIRKTIDYTGIMYYKINKLTEAAISRRQGHKHVSTYMHTYLGRFYVRNLVGDWILEERNQRSVPISSRFHRANYSGLEELPSTSQRRFLNLPSGAKGGANWYLKCSSSNASGAYLPEADRVWIVAKELLGEGMFRRISWCKNARGVEVRFYTTAGSGVRSQLGTYDRILRGASIPSVMYFTRGNEENIRYSYKYTAEGELYEQTKFAEKFVLER